MSNLFDRHLAIAGAYNIRDLGGYQAEGGETQWRRILRADALHRVDADGMAQLVAHGLRTVIDLRHLSEMAMAPNPFRDHPEVRYLALPLFDDLAPSRMAALRGDTLGRGRGSDVLLALYCLALAERQAEIRQVLTAIAEAPEGAVLFHCTAGKDRTGIIAALLLALAGVATPTILEDYALTKSAIAPILEDIIAGAVARGADLADFMPLLACEPATMQAMLDHLDADYDGLAAYLARIGLEPATIERLRIRLLAEAA